MGSHPRRRRSEPRQPGLTELSLGRGVPGGDNGSRLVVRFGSASRAQCHPGRAIRSSTKLWRQRFRNQPQNSGRSNSPDLEAMMRVIDLPQGREGGRKGDRQRHPRGDPSGDFRSWRWFSVDPTRSIRDVPTGVIAVTVLEWADSTDVRQVVGWSLIYNDTSAEEFASRVEAIPYQPGVTTSVGGAIAFATKLLELDGLSTGAPCHRHFGRRRKHRWTVAGGRSRQGNQQTNHDQWPARLHGAQFELGRLLP